MNKSKLIRLVVVLAAVMCALGAAAAEAYACYTPSNTTLTFYYDNLRSSRSGTTYDLNTGNDAPGWYTDGTKSTVAKVVFNSSFANARPTTTYRWFYEMRNLESITGMSYLNTSEVTNMGYMFAACNNMKMTSLDLSHFNTSKVTSMWSMFYGSARLTSLDLSNFNTSNVTDMRSMFNGCAGLTSLDLSNWNTSNVTDMWYMFHDCTGLTSIDLSNWNTSKVLSFYCMFEGCTGLTSLDLSSFNTSAVVTMGYMFRGCTNLRTIYAGTGWSTAAVTYSIGMFTNCRNLVGGKGTTYDVNHTDQAYAHIDGGPSNPGYFTDKNVHVAYACYTPSNTTLTFYYDNQRYSRSGTTYDLNIDTYFPDWNIDGTYSDVTRVVFDPSFAGARPTTTFRWFDSMRNLQSITGLSNLNTSEVTDMGYMFYNCNQLTGLDLSSFNTSRVYDMSRMFYGCSGLRNLDLSNFNTSRVYDMSNMFIGCARLTSLDLSSFTTGKVTNMEYMFDYCTNLRTIYAGTGWSTAAVTNSGNMFANCTSLVGGRGTTYDANHVDKAYAHIDGGPSNPGYFTVAGTEAYACYTPSNTTLTFYYDNQRNSRWDTYDLNIEDHTPDWCADGTHSHVTKVAFDPSFAGARPTSTFAWFIYMDNLESITGMNYLNTSEVTDMSLMFYGCKQLTSIDLSGWNTSNVTAMRGMFYDCTGMTSLDLSNFNTSKVDEMGGMFLSCTGLTTLDLSSFNTSQVTDMRYMFSYCTNLRTIYAGSGWNTAAVTESADMFANCTSLVGGKGTTFDSNHTDKAYAHIDGGPSNPGYFTDKNAVLRGDLNGDDHVDVNDVTILIGVVLGTTTDYNAAAADCDVAGGSGNIDVNDVTALISYVLNGHW